MGTQFWKSVIAALREERQVRKKTEKKKKKKTIKLNTKYAKEEKNFKREEKPSSRLHDSYQKVVKEMYQVVF
jgi:hypothetical protein